ncbi:uncharacterized protein LAESUDRAFT_36924 [Laetiporus sulphureus 93-53]|uniref:Uncharacterized protein n=1 Tax=Laetiporus sulphureus 93-53 TaxID=1314785 RepID=A0A165ILR6_9APHY|nr:uncharacterized protein LAESUDRAFT_36924 [Laetiporus sulphureus 93-53]KZT13256.1 hypothetical protein LAESUDRAFT_36924 [Laetiporus sulphureus 93-53]
MLNMSGTRLEKARITFSAPEEDAGGSFQSLPLHPISLEANVNLQELGLGINTSELNDLALFVRSVLQPRLETISSKYLKDIYFIIESNSKWETDALLNAFDQEACYQTDELLAEGHFAKLRGVSIAFRSDSTELDDSQRVNFCTEICARFPKLNGKNMLSIDYNLCRFPSDAERALKAKQLANKQPRPTEQGAT